MDWTGKVVEFASQGKLELGLVLEEKKGRLRVLTVQKKERLIDPEKVLHKSAAPFPTKGTREELCRALREVDLSRASLEQAMELQELWELVHEDVPPEGFSFQELCELYLPTEVEADVEAAFLRRLHHDVVFFKRQKKSFFPNPQKMVERILEARQAEAEREKEKEKLLQWVRQTWQEGEEPELEPSLRQKGINYLREFALGQASGRVKNTVKHLLREAGVPYPEGAFELLIKLGEFSADENLDLLKHKVPIEFSQEAQEAAQKLWQSYPHELESEKQRRSVYGREELFIFSIDEVTTKDRDDALSLEPWEKGWRLGIHIADVAHWILPHTTLDKVAMERGTSIYLPDQTIDMFPEEVMKQIASLDEGEEKLAISLFVYLRDDGQWERYEIQETVISVSRNYHYREAEILLEEGDETLTKIYHLANQIYQNRLHQGGKPIFFPYLNIRADGEGRISLEKVIAPSKTQFLVSELMILANHLFGEYLDRCGLPAIFRSQMAPESFISLEEVNYLTLYEVRKFLRRSEVSPYPKPHFTLGLSHYLQATSPIRRYSDLVNQRQLKSTLSQYSPYPAEEVEQIIQRTELAVETARTITRARRNYWILKYLKELGKTTLPALVLHQYSSGRLLVQIHDELPPSDAPAPYPHLYECTLPYRGSEKIQPGTWISVYVSRLDPRRQIFEVTFASILEEASATSSPQPPGEGPSRE